MEVKDGYKKTDVGLIPENWEVVRVNDVLELLTDYDANGSFASVAKNVRVYDYEQYAWYVRSTDLENGTHITNVRYVDKDSYNFLKKTSLKGGELLFLKRGDIGSVYLFEMKTEFATVAPNLYLLKLNEKIIPHFLFYYFTAEKGQRQLKSKNASSTLGALYKDDVKSIQIPLPPLPEQQAIAEVLSDTDNLIQALEKQIAKKRLIKQGVMQKLLTPKDGWEEKKFCEIFEICGGYSASRDQLSNDGFCYLHYGDIHGSTKTFIDCNVDFFNIPKLKIGLNKISKKFLLKNGDVVFVDASEDDEGTSRHIIIRNKNNIPFISGLHTIVAKSKDESLNIKYKSYCFQVKYVKDQFKFYAVGTKVSGISKTSIKNIKIHIPPITEQINIANTLEAMDMEIEVIEKKLMKYKSMKQGLKQNLLTGKIRLIKS